MPINMSFAGNIPWLITEPPTAALARGAQVGEGIAHQRLAQQQINLQAAQQQEAQAHRQVEEGIQKAQEARLQANATRVADMELRRGIGMQAVTDAMGLFDKRNPDATDAERFKEQSTQVFKHSSELFHTGAELGTWMDNTSKAMSAMQDQPLKNEEIKATTRLRTMQAAKAEAEANSANLGENVKGAAPREQKLAALLQKATDEGDTYLMGVYRTALDSEAVKQQNAGTRIQQSNQRLGNATTDLELKATEAGFEIKHNQDGTKTLSPIAKPLTAANTTSYQKALNSDLDTLDRIGRLMPMVNPSTIGPLAVGGSVVLDKTLANIFPQLANKERITVGELLTIQASELTKALESRSQLSNQERKQLLEAIPTKNEILTSPVRALSQMRTLGQEVATKARQAAMLLRQPMPDSLKTPDEIKADLKAGKITIQKARDLISRSVFDLPAAPTAVPIQGAPAPAEPSAQENPL